MNFEGTIILVDPVFSKSATPVSFVARRFQKPVIPLEELSDIDIIQISNDLINPKIGELYKLKSLPDINAWWNE